MTARQREAVNLTTLNNVELVKQAWPQTGFRATLADAFRPVKPRVRQTKLLRDFAMKLKAEFGLVAFVQQARIRITRVAKVRVGIVKLGDPIGKRQTVQRSILRRALCANRERLDAVCRQR